MQKNKLNFLFILLMLGFVSCVSNKKYNDLQASKTILQKEYDDLRATLQEKRILGDSLRHTETRLREVNNNLLDLKARYESLLQNSKDLNSRYDQLLKQNNDLVNTSSTEKQSLSEQLAARQRDVELKERQLNELEAALKARESNLAQLNTSLSDQQKKVDDLNAMIKAKDAVMTQLRTRLNDALRGFSASDLSVREENGRVYVSLSQNLLFPKGSDQIDAKGVDALKKLAVVLNNNADIEINVEGHTDADGTAERNWDLSVSRATTIVKVLTDSKVDPKRITASGRALYHPVAPNDVEPNKAKNRRTEIILSPKLDELYELIKNE